MIAESELIGFPRWIEVSPWLPANGDVENTSRRGGEKTILAADEAVPMISNFPADFRAGPSA